ncbi:MAG TPA: methyl-accepting chemotaxis protein [Dissulfurispiraceae bacterium]|nr:methyl-accepting chemotaxis protein [Dissulfurispiraceae bacterium]
MKSLPTTQKNFLANVSIGTRLSAFSSALVLIIFAVVITVVYLMASTVVKDQNRQALKNQAALVRDMIATFDKAARTGADKTGGLFAGMFRGGTFTLGGAPDAPILSVGGKPLNGVFTDVDEFTKDSKGSVATIFARKGEDLLRISTSLKKDDGTRAVGTTLDKSHPGYKAIMEGKEYIGPAKLFGKDYMTKYMPVKSAQGAIIGALFVGFDITKDLMELSAAVKSIKVGDTGYVYAFFGEGKDAGTMVIHPSLEGKNVLEAKTADGKALFKDMIAQKEGYVEYDWKNEGESSARSKAVAFAHYPGFNWVIATGGYASELNKAVTIMASVSAIGGILGVGALSVLMFVMIRVILRPLGRLVDTANRVASGDLTASLEYPRNDEIGKVFNAMESMVNNLKRLIGEIKNSTATLAAGSEQLSASSEEISRNMDDQSNRASQIATSAEEMSQTVINVAKNASAISDSARGAADRAKEGEHAVEQSIIETNAISGTVHASAKVMQTLVQKSNQIGEIISVINDIADQTNLLALNAAIEAARAGEQGRGFAVVADEVRKLAERTGKATSEIGVMIRSVQEEVQEATASMDDTAKRVETGVKMSTKAGATLRDIVSRVEALQSMVQQIASATEEMSSVADHISGDVQSIAGAAKEISSGAEQIARTSSDIAQQGSNLQTSVSQFKV